MERSLQDLKLAIRRLWKDRGFAATALLTLVVCLGANAVLLSVVRSVLLKPLPFAESGRVLLMYSSYPNAGAPRGDSGVTDYYDRLRELTVFDSLTFFRERGITLGHDGSVERLRAVAATPSFFDLLRASAYRGRVFKPEEGEVGANHVVVLSYALWQRLFAGSESALGQDLRLNGLPHKIVGVMPRDFALAGTEAELWTPLAFTPDERADSARHSNNGTLLGRLKPGATLAQTQRELDALDARNLERFGGMKQALIDVGYHSVVLPLHDDLVRDVKPVLLLLWAGVVCVLLIGCVNIANLVLVRTSGRLKEIATRRALGADRAAIARQGLIETTLLTLLGAGLALLFARWAIGAMVALAPAMLPRMNEIALDGPVIAAVLAVAVLLGAALGLVPAVAVPRLDLNAVLREEGRGGSRGRASRRTRHALVTAQVAFAFVLLVGAALLAASFRHVLGVDPGWKAEGVLTATVSLPAARYAEDADRRGFAGRLLEATQRVPGVGRAGLTSSIPFGGSYDSSVVIPEGPPPQKGESLISPNQLAISPGYLEAMGINLVRGRLFTAGDDPAATAVAIVDEELAKRFWPGQDPIGRRYFRPIDPQHLVADGSTQYLTVVGVVRNATLRALVGGAPAVGTCYVPLAQSPARTLTMAIKTAGDPLTVLGGLRREVAALDPELPVFEVRTMNERVHKELGPRRVPMILALVFGGVSLFLAAVGIYGVLAYQVAQRQREIGIRMALGGTKAAIGRLVLADSARLVGVGLTLGIVGALGLGPAMRGLLYGVQPLDAGIFAAIALVLFTVALAAALLPARRAQRVNPSTALSD